MHALTDSQKQTVCGTVVTVADAYTTVFSLWD